jgi:hypothetical protein
MPECEIVYRLGEMSDWDGKFQERSENLMVRLGELFNTEPRRSIWNSNYCFSDTPGVAEGFRDPW